MSVCLSVCLSVPSRNTHLSVCLRFLVEGRIANTSLASQFFFVFQFWWFVGYKKKQYFLVVWTSLRGLARYSVSMTATSGSFLKATTKPWNYPYGVILVSSWIIDSGFYKKNQRSPGQIPFQKYNRKSIFLDLEILTKTLEIKLE